METVMVKAAITANARINVCFFRFIPRAKFLLKVFMTNLLFESDFCCRSEVWWSLAGFAPGLVRIAALGFIQQKNKLQNRPTYLRVFLFLTGTQTFQRIFVTRPIRGEAWLGRRSPNSVASASLRWRSAHVTVPKACAARTFQANSAKFEE